MNKGALWTIVIIIVLIVGGVIFAKMNNSSNSNSNLVPGLTGLDKDSDGDGDDHSSMDMTASSTSSDTSVSAGANITVDAAGVKNITVSNQGFKFNPSTLTLKKGDKVKVTFNNTGGFHDLKIEGYNVGTKQIQANTSDSFEFTADKAGSFVYYCSVGNHRAMGMWGTLTVTE